MFTQTTITLARVDAKGKVVGPRVALTLDQFGNATFQNEHRTRVSIPAGLPGIGELFELLTKDAPADEVPQTTFSEGTGVVIGDQHRQFSTLPKMQSE